MRVDMRPGVVAKVMTKELLLFGLALLATASMPVYFYKVKPMKEKYAMEQQEKLLEGKSLQDIQPKKPMSLASTRMDMSVSTSDKLQQRYSDIQIKREIEKAEKELREEAIRNERLMRLTARRGE